MIRKNWWAIGPVVAAGLVLWLTIGTGDAAARRAGGGKARKGSESPQWTAANEWELGGAYAEACSDPPVCGAHFGAPPADGDCRKVIVLQISRGRYRGTDLTGLSAAVIAESPPGAPLLLSNRKAWRRCDLLVSDAADTAQTTGLAVAIGGLLSGPHGPAFTHVERVPLATGISKDRIVADSPGRLRVYMTPMHGRFEKDAPSIYGLSGPFPFLGERYLDVADTLYYGGVQPAWAFARRSALFANFFWNSQAAADQETPQ